MAKTATTGPAREALNACKNRGEIRRLLAAVREEIGEYSYLSELQAFGVTDALQLPRNRIEQLYERLLEIVARQHQEVA